MYIVESVRRGSPRGPYVYSFRGKSAFAKPKLADYPDMATGSDLWDIDTGRVYTFDADIDDWLAQ